MKPPPFALGRLENDRATAEAARLRARAFRERAQAVRLSGRALLLQCECGAVSTGRITHRGILVSQGMKVEHGRHTVSAGNGGRCGGLVRIFDPKTGEDAA